MFEPYKQGVSVQFASGRKKEFCNRVFAHTFTQHDRWVAIKRVANGESDIIAVVPADTVEIVEIIQAQ